ncbi:MAG: 4Fe-4S dicluster domain-containing protein, partial [Candidatus Saccharibacteria bacterium]
MGNGGQEGLVPKTIKKRWKKIMPKKYHIHPKDTPLDMEYLHKFKITRGENCINCGKCTKVCIYEAHKRRKGDPRKMADPNTVVCRNCFRCIQECPRGALEKSLQQDYVNISGSFWKADMFLTLWKQAEDGKVPVTGAGYRGPFTGAGFDSMWTDMSEIVRPTRDGIHGREYINTGVELGRKLGHLAFDAEGCLLTQPYPTVDIPIPILFDIPPVELSPNVMLALVKAASHISTCIILQAADIKPELAKYSESIIPFITEGEVDKYADILKNARLVAIDYNDDLPDKLAAIKERIKNISNAVTIIRVPAIRAIEGIVSKLVNSGAEVIHIVADYRGLEINQDQEANFKPRLMKDIIRSIHLKLVEERIRDEITLIFSGGMAMAEHVPKSMLCGSDLTAIDMPLLIALGARLYEKPEKLLLLPDGLDKIPADIMTQRIVNLMCAWH